MPLLRVKDEQGVIERITKNYPYWSGVSSCRTEMGNKIEQELWGQNNMDLNSEESMLYSSVNRNSVGLSKIIASRILSCSRNRKY